MLSGNHLVLHNLWFLNVLFIRELYKSYEENKEDKNRRMHKFCKTVAHKYNPAVAIAFVIIYWSIGLHNAQFF